MPRRWLSVRGQKEAKEAKDVPHVTQEQFDFEFVTTSHDPESPSTSAKAISAMFNNPSFRPKKSKSDLSPSSTSSNSKIVVDRRLQLTKVEDSWIGVAFGSPTHPPSVMPSLSGSESTASLKHAFRTEGPLPASSPYMARCRKIGNLFKSKPNQLLISAPTQAYRIDGDQKFDMPIATKPWRSPNSPPDWINSENPEAFTTSLAGVVQESSPFHRPVPPKRPSRDNLPKLEIQIPDVEMDRYSVMFSDVSGIQSSGLLERRSRNLDSLRLFASHEHLGPPPPPPTKPLPIPRPTTPTHRRKSSNYSLFPSPPKQRSSSFSISPDRQLPRRQLSFSSSSSRPATASGHSSAPSVGLMLKTEGTNLSPPRKGSDSLYPSPDETVASSVRDDSPWRSTESLRSPASSRTSVGSEIFFDLKPVRDANGREQSHYIIQKPDSSSVEMAISKSRKARRERRRRREEEARSASMISPDLQAAEHLLLKGPEKWRLSMELNQAIAEVERLTSPLSSLLPAFEMPRAAALATSPYTQPSPKDQLTTVRLRKRLDSHAIGIPSPITERSEEFSPRQPSANKSNRVPPRPHIASLSIQPAPLVISDLHSAAIPGGTFAITPPPVPVKDAKFLPISKFAGGGSGNTHVKLVDHRPKRRKPKRSATESNIVTQLSSFPNPPKTKERKRERPVTMSGAGSMTTKQLLPMSPNTAKRIEAGIVAVTVQPTAEVSVARTISLERKQSHQILVTSPGLSGTRPGPALSPSGRCLSPIFQPQPPLRPGKRGYHQQHKHGASLNLVAERTGY